MDIQLNQTELSYFHCTVSVKEFTEKCEHVKCSVKRIVEHKKMQDIPKRLSPFSVYQPV
jgi:hypothetical protein